jgi:hypothetical protein
MLPQFVSHQAAISLIIIRPNKNNILSGSLNNDNRHQIFTYYYYYGRKIKRPLKEGKKLKRAESVLFSLRKRKFLARGTK